MQGPNKKCRLGRHSTCAPHLSSTPHVATPCYEFQARARAPGRRHHVPDALSLRGKGAAVGQTATTIPVLDSATGRDALPVNPRV